MQTGSATPLRHSTVARFELVVNQTSYDVGEVAGSFLYLRTPADIPAGEADLYIRVEGEDEIHRRIRLPQGASADSPRVVIEREG
jgi:hypothetical protein